MPNILKAACVQLNVGPSIADNLKITEELIREAAGQGAKLILTPENTCFMRFPLNLRPKDAQPQEGHDVLTALQALAKELGVWIIIGSLGIKLEEGRLANRSFVISDAGEIVNTYDKIHMFDVDLPDGESYRESKTIKPGENAVLVDTGAAKTGLSICYDLRFAELYRTLAQGGAQILTVPAAFTVPTGKAHWETLLRARAIENGAFVMAAGQWGEHENGLKTWGHSMIIGPWGEILAEKDAGVGIITADLNLDDVEKARTAIPSLQHDRAFKLN